MVSLVQLHLRKSTWANKPTDMRSEGSRPNSQLGQKDKDFVTTTIADQV